MNASLNPNKGNVIRIVIYVVLITVFYLLCMARGTLGGFWFVTVNAMPFLVASIGFFEGPYVGGSLGLYSGLLMSVSSSTVEGAEALVMALFGIFCGSVALMLMRRILPSVLFCGTVFLTARGIISATYYTMFYSIPFLNVIVSYIEIILVSLIPGIIGYYLVSSIHRRFSEEND
ncbi:MAG: hypothetical protein VB078_12065 [Clostridiaceae bacterium]|nr:hypothetical protein [Clostridiaceae bacterium]